MRPRLCRHRRQGLRRCDLKAVSPHPRYCWIHYTVHRLAGTLPARRYEPKALYPAAPLVQHLRFLIRCGYTSGDLAARSGLTRESIQRMLVRTAPLTESVADRWAVAFGRNLDELWTPAERDLEVGLRFEAMSA